MECAGPSASGPTYHVPAFDIDERSIGVTTEILARAALTRLGADR